MKHTFIFAVLLAVVLPATAQQFSLVEINPQQGTEAFLWSDSAKHVYGAGEFSSMVELNGRLYFAAQNSYYNYELWSTDGTQAGTQLVKELNVSGGSGIGKLHRVGNKIVFAATEDSLNSWNTPDYDLYVSDGTTSGTSKLMELNESSNAFLETGRVATLQNKFIFCTATQVVATDGTPGGTLPLAAIAQYAQGFGYCEMNGHVYFVLVENGQPGVWKSDGTAAGTSLIKNLSTANIPLAYAEDMKAFDNKLYIVGAVSGQGSDLYSFDGTTGGLLQPLNLAPGSNAYPTELEVYGGRLWLLASNMTAVNLYSMEPGDAAPAIVTTATDVDYATQLAFANNRVYYANSGMSAIHSVGVAQLQHTKLDLTDKRLPWFWNNGAPFMLGLGNHIFFIAYDTLQQQQYFMSSDGTPSGTQSFAPVGSNTLHPFNALISCGMADVFDFTVFGNKVVVPANFNDAGRELWFFEKQELVNSLPKETPQAKFDLYPNPAADRVFVKCITPSTAGYYTLQLSDLSGKTIQQKTMSGNEMALELVHLPAGTYWATLSGEGLVTQTQKFLVIK